MEAMINSSKFLWESHKGRDRLEDPGVDVTITLKWILNRMRGDGLDSIGSG
jgi:hypothetical protein